MVGTALAKAFFQSAFLSSATVVLISASKNGANGHGLNGLGYFRLPQRYCKGFRLLMQIMNTD
ncbi:hypothetical protein GCWU000324_01454 [Kingella oralis ATCC 51147]|uniref:Uncharacterized protein n=1 Tax=Kingella oralis ATCC 51147 TaxID=629741 RepID=C4GKF1_9NEIS|nr:hypothetical protein GCWU000324_01454 [Kingella oralis ATCC 51147]